MILATRFTFIGYTQKGLNNLQFMTSYLVTIENDHHELKMCTRDKQTATGVLSSTKKLRKTSGEWGGGGHHSPRSPRPVRPRANLNACKWALLSIIIFYWT